MSRLQRQLACQTLRRLALVVCAGEDRLLVRGLSQVFDEPVAGVERRRGRTPGRGLDGSGTGTRCGEGARPPGQEAEAEPLLCWGCMAALSTLASIATVEPKNGEFVVPALVAIQKRKHAALFPHHPHPAPSSCTFWHCPDAACRGIAWCLSGETKEQRPGCS